MAVQVSMAVGLSAFVSASVTLPWTKANFQALSRFFFS